MKTKQWISVLLCMLLCIGMLPAMAFAANEADAWDGTVDTSWYTGNETEYNITSAAALAGVSKLANEGNSFQGITLKLTTDVDLSGLPWTPIKKFQGIFDGDNHTVSNMCVELENGQSGFFEYLNNATVKNLVLEQATVVVSETNTSFYQGILAGWVQGATIENCGVVSGSITANLGEDAWSPSIGGLIGSCKGKDSLKLLVNRRCKDYQSRRKCNGRRPCGAMGKCCRRSTDYRLLFWWNCKCG